jgi:hypothetical protein
MNLDWKIMIEPFILKTKFELHDNKFWNFVKGSLILREVMSKLDKRP